MDDEYKDEILTANKIDDPELETPLIYDTNQLNTELKQLNAILEKPFDENQLISQLERIKSMTSTKFVVSHTEDEVKEEIIKQLLIFMQYPDNNIVTMSVSIARTLTQQENLFEEIFLSNENILILLQNLLGSGDYNICYQSLCILSNLFDYNTDFGIAFMNDAKIDLFLTLLDVYGHDIHEYYIHFFNLFSSKLFDPALLVDIISKIDFNYSDESSIISENIILTLALILYRCDFSFQWIERFMGGIEPERRSGIIKCLAAQIMPCILEEHSDFFKTIFVKLLTSLIQHSFEVSLFLISMEYMDQLMSNLDVYSFALKSEIIQFVCIVLIHKEFEFVDDFVNKGIFTYFQDWLDMETPAISIHVLQCISKICQEFEENESKFALASFVTDELIDTVKDILDDGENELKFQAAVADSALLTLFEDE